MAGWQSWRMCSCPQRTPPRSAFMRCCFAFWLIWTTFMLYGNVAAGQTRVVRLLIGMFGLGVMAASVPGVADSVLGDSDNERPLTVFAIAYISTRIFGSTLWQ
ncbi:low temperature requirement protein A [Micromonospora sp. M12]